MTLIGILNISLKNILRLRVKTLFMLLIVAIGVTTYCIVNNLAGIIDNTMSDNIIKSSEVRKITVDAKKRFDDNVQGLSNSTIEKISQISNIEKIFTEMHTAIVLFHNDQPIERFSIVNYPLAQNKLITGEDYTKKTEKNIIILPDLTLSQGNQSVTCKSLVGKNVKLKVPIQNEKGVVVEEKIFSALVSGVYKAKGVVEENPALVRAEFILDIMAAERKFKNVEIFKQNYSADRLIVYVNNPENVSVVANKIESMNLDTNYLEKNIKNFSKNINGFKKVGEIISFIVIGIGILLLINTLLFNIMTRQKEIGVMKAIGFSNVKVGIMVFIESMILISAGTIISLTVQLLSYNIINEYLKKWNLIGSLAITSSIILRLLLITLGLSVLTAIIPIKKCYKVDPIYVLKGE